MRSLLCTIALAAFLFPFSPALAQKAKDKDKGKEDKPTATITISEGVDGKFRFTVRNAEGKFLANSGANNFPSEKEALKGAEDFKAAVGAAKIVVSKDRPKPKTKGKDPK
ncbi:MAG: hypothetical protein K2W96_09430 [Gemmataceae bacterium]|nr:hypothetical protein [Gemmataceae bacterium]